MTVIPEKNMKTVEKLKETSIHTLFSIFKLNHINIIVHRTEVEIGHFISFCFVWFYGAPTLLRSYGAETGKMVLADLDNKYEQ
jgi:hypothetical protein